MTLQKFKKSIKKYFALVFDPKKKERGIAPLVAIGWIGLTITLAWYFKSAIGKEILYGAGSLVLAISKILFDISSTIFETVGSSALLKKAITQDQTVRDGWAIVRDFANMFIVLGFVVVGIATILRIRTYEAQKTLLPLILVALLVNFSLLICGIIIDATNIAVNYFTTQQGGGPSGIVLPLKPFIDDPAAGNLLTSYYNSDDWINYASLSFSLSIYIGISAMIFFIYAVLFLFRYVALMCLVILSPLAFVCYVFPATKPIFNKWWSQFTQWAIIGIPTAFFIYLGGHLFQSFANQPNAVLAFWVPVTFMLFAYTLIFQTSAIGASSAIGLATGAMGFAWGTTKWTGGKALRGGGSAIDKASGGRFSSAGRQISSGVGRAMERLGLKDTGTTATTNTKRVEDRAKILANEYAAAKATGNTATMERIQRLARTSKGVEEGAAIKVVFDAKDLHKTFKTSTGGVDLAAMAAKLNYAESVGAKDIIKDSEKRMPGLAAYNRTTTREIEGTVNPDTGVKYTPHEAEREAVRKRNAEMHPSDMGDLHESQIDANHLEDVRYRTYSRASLNYNADQIKKVKSLIPELRDKKYVLLGIPGATPAARAAAYSAMTPAAKTAAMAALPTAKQSKARDLNRKIVFTKKL